MTRIGFIGLGAMGSAIAGRLLDAGYEVLAWNRSAAAIDTLVERGAQRAHSPSEALAAPVSFSMLANDEAVREVLTGANLEGTAGRTHVCLSSISPEAAESLAATCERNAVGYASAPVLGRPEAAVAGRLHVLLAGTEETVARVRPLFEAFAVRTWDIATSPRAANIVKIAVNYTIIHALQALGESVAMVEQNGADPAEYVELLHETLFSGVVYGGYGRLIARRAYRPPGFPLELGYKDLNLAQTVAADAGLDLAAMPPLFAAFQQVMADPSLSGSDWSAIAEASRRPVRP
jgi:3-hydroxyisobutyrate dehydrogenase-like beta-hydroxyacid dehydrogenase